MFMKEEAILRKNIKDPPLQKDKNTSMSDMRKVHWGKNETILIKEKESQLVIALEEDCENISPVYSCEYLFVNENESLEEWENLSSKPLIDDKQELCFLDEEQFEMISKKKISNMIALSIAEYTSKKVSSSFPSKVLLGLTQQGMQTLVGSSISCLSSNPNAWLSFGMKGFRYIQYGKGIYGLYQQLSSLQTPSLSCSDIFTIQNLPTLISIGTTLISFI